jgi:GrpB-like predicted nucleotidyltransferase (UPF0157 family)
VPLRNPLYLSKAIAVVDYDPRWAESFDVERTRVLAVLGELVVQLEHFGSTSVPGLAAKPIVDMLAGVIDLDRVAARSDDLLAIGYQDYGVQVAGRRLFAIGGPANEASHHLQVVEYGTAAWFEPLRFRDRLRADPELVRRYAQLKRELAAAHGRDIRAYSDGKTEFVGSVLS